MTDPDRRRRSRSGQALDALVWGAALGGASGAVLGAAVDGIGAGAGALIGAALIATAELLTTLRRRLGELKPLWQRILSSALLLALLGWALRRVAREAPATAPPATRRGESQRAGWWRTPRSARG
jgi:hypothetical protein